MKNATPVVQNLERKDLGAKDEAKARTLRVLFRFVKLEPKEILELGRDFKDPASPSREPSPDEIAEAKIGIGHSQINDAADKWYVEAQRGRRKARGALSMRMPPIPLRLSICAVISSNRKNSCG